uniref:Transmembrane protein n=1 Tax=Anguilla anguilla TaxID=7936 RepID=A0A0E9QUA6_ANGAN
MLEKRNIHRELGKEMERGMREEEEKTTKTACFLSPLFLSLPFTIFLTLLQGSHHFKETKPHSFPLFSLSSLIFLFFPPKGERTKLKREKMASIIE